MTNMKYSGVRESKSGRINDLGTTSKEAEENFKKICMIIYNSSVMQKYKWYEWIFAFGGGA